MKINISKSMECSKISYKREVHSNKCLPQETRKVQHEHNKVQDGKDSKVDRSFTHLPKKLQLNYKTFHLDNQLKNS